MDDESRIFAPDELEMELLAIIGEGAGSVARMLRLARAIEKNCDNVPQHIKELAAITQDSHMERALHRWVQKQPWRALLPKKFDFKVPCTYDGIHESEMMHSCILPHELFGTLYKFKDLFAHMFIGADGVLEAFWEHAKSSDWYKRHPVFEVSQDPTHCVPIGIYGDDAGVFNNEKVLVLLWGGVVEDHPTLLSRLLFSAVQYSRVIPHKTLPAVYKVWVWGLTCLASGEYPVCDHEGRLFSREYCPDRMQLAGTRIAGEYVGVFSEMRGDWKYLVESLHLHNFYSTVSCCHLCRASKKNKRLLFTNFVREAPIRKTLCSHAEFLRAHREDPSELFRIPGFSIWRVWVDAAHNLDLGVYQIVCASALVELVQENVWPAPTVKERFALAHADHKEWCKVRGLSAPPRFDKQKLLKIQDAYATSAGPLGLQSACPGSPSKQLRFATLLGHTRTMSLVAAHTSKEIPFRANVTMSARAGIGKGKGGHLIRMTPQRGERMRNLPCFTQHQAKGVMTKGIMLWLTEVCDRPGISATEHGRLRQALFYNFREMETIFSHHGRCIPAEALALAQTACENALVCLNALSARSQASGTKFYHILPKSHMTTHMCFDFAPQANPRKVQCYSDEDMVGRTKKVVSKCHGSTAGTMGVMRYMILAGVRWWRELAEIRGV